MKNECQILLDTLRLILRLPSEADSIKIQDFDDRNGEAFITRDLQLESQQ